MGTLMGTVMDILPDMSQIKGSVQEIADTGLHISNLSTEGLIATAVLGVLICIMGLRFVKFYMACLGMIIGCMVGYTAGMNFGATEVIALVIGLVFGIILALLSLNLYRAGAFLFCFVLGFSTCAAIMQPLSVLFVIICVVIGIIAGGIAVKLADPVIVVCTAVGGGLSAGIAIANLTKLQGWYFSYIIGGVLVVIGLIIQFLYASKKVNKKSVAKAKAIRAEKSVENEVEAARAMLDQSEILAEEELAADGPEEAKADDDAIGDAILSKDVMDEEEEARDIIEQTQQELKESGTLDRNAEMLDFEDEDEDIEVDQTESEAAKMKQELEETKKELEKMKKELEEAKKE